MVNLNDVKSYLKIDYDDEDTYLEMLLIVSEIYIDKCCGEAYKNDVKLLKLSELAQLKLINDMYENRSASITEATKRDTIISSIFTLLSLSGDVYES